MAVTLVLLMKGGLSVSDVYSNFHENPPYIYMLTNVKVLRQLMWIIFYNSVVSLDFHCILCSLFMKYLVSVLKM